MATLRKHSPSIDEQLSEGRLAQPHRLFQHRIEHRRQIAGRGIDHLQHLGGRGLLLQRLALFGDQPRILHRDHRLCGEVLQQRYLLLGERPHFLPVDVDMPQHSLVFAERHREDGAYATELDHCAGAGIAIEI